MKDFQINDLMVPLEEYATIPVGSSLFEAVGALEKAQEEFDSTKYRHRAILVLDDTGHVVGKLSQLDVLRALDPKYQDICEAKSLKAISRFGFSADFIRNMCDQYQLFGGAMADICKMAATVNVEDCMYQLSEGEFIDIDATLDTAIHQLVIGHHQSLLVKDGNTIVGILRLTDVFVAVFHAMKECNI